MKKLTLTAEPEVIDMAKKLAEARGTSVSAMFSQLIRAMGARRSRRDDPLGPVTRRLTGIARAPRGKSDRRLLEDALLQKYAS
ncbi:MAG: DUF6364 family protein [Tepidisphaeraceae bacterium]|jgi:hypothetical protein